MGGMPITFYLSLAIFAYVNLAALQSLARNEYSIDITQFQEVAITPHRSDDKSIYNLWGGLVTSDTLIQKLENVLVKEVLAEHKDKDGTVACTHADMAYYGEPVAIMNELYLLGARDITIYDSFLSKLW
jgi:hypothetical protein